MSFTEENIEQFDNIIKFEGLSFLVFDHLDTLNIEDVQNHDAVIIKGKDESFIRQIVRRIRAHDKSFVYLKPVFLLKSASIVDPLINQLVDGSLYALEQIPFIKAEVETKELQKIDIEKAITIPKSDIQEISETKPITIEKEKEENEKE